MKEPSAQVQHATNDFCIAPRLAECGAHSMDISFSRQFRITTGPKRVWEWIISTQQTTFVWRLVLRNLALTGSWDQRTWCKSATRAYARASTRTSTRSYRWRKGLKSIKTGSKWAQNNCSCTPNGPQSLLEKRAFDPFFTHFCSQNGPFAKHFEIFNGPKPVTMGSNWAKNTCLSIPNGSRSLVKKRVLDAILALFWS